VSTREQKVTVEDRHLACLGGHASSVFSKFEKSGELEARWSMIRAKRSDGFLRFTAGLEKGSNEDLSG
jgi:hypothetical protein